MNWLPAHRSHDYLYLIDRWQRVARRAGLEVRQMTVADGIPVFAMESKAALRGQPLTYLSTGVHGDEVAAVCGLLSWAEANVELLRKGSFLILPCVNPVGLSLNTRLDHRGLDINRRFHMKDDAVCGPWHELVAGKKMLAGICLHEDYDAVGAYVYELNTGTEVIGHDLLAACADVIPADARRMIDGRKADRGVIRRRRFPRDLPGLPEAIVLHQIGCPVTLTFETPSEFSLDTRIVAQHRFIDAAVDWIHSTQIR